MGTMHFAYQRTIKKTVSCTGIGIHSGKKVHLTFRPAPANTGIVFSRIDLPGPSLIKVDAASISETQNATTLGNNGIRVGTVEHLMAAIAGLSIDNIIIEVNADEVPIMDGSAAPFVFLLKEAGIQRLLSSRTYCKIHEPIEVRDGDRWVSIYPAPTFSITYTIEFDHVLIQRQSFHFDGEQGEFVEEISPARTFGFLHEVEFLKANGLAHGGSLDNAVVIDKTQVINEEGLRYPQEFVRHKILDAIGDLSLLGHPVIGHVIAHKSGHELNLRLVQKIVQNKKKWSNISLVHSRTSQQLSHSFAPASG